jgi:FkbM family methyltransferase
MDAFFRKIISFCLRRIGQNSIENRAITNMVSFRLAANAYGRLYDAGFRPNGIIDIGAHYGEWSKDIRRIFPAAPILMVEAKEEERARLTGIAAAIRNASCEITLLGTTARQNVEFHVHGSGSSIFSERSDAPRSTRQIDMTMLDTVTSRHPELKAPLFVKIDVQGAELEVLGGGSQTLAMAEAVQMEVALLHYNEGAPSANDVIAFMNKAGFAIYDIAGEYRPLGSALAQLDLIFVRKDSVLRRDYFEFERPAAAMS